MHMDIRLSLILIVSACLLGTALTVAEAAPRPPWYWLVLNVEGTAQTCEPAARDRNTPEDHIGLVEAQRWPYKMVDVEENGEVVQTTMIRYPSRWGDRSEMTWYRGKARCEQAKRQKEQAGEAWRNEMIRKYR
jgi:hypothetical protein